MCLGTISTIKYNDPTAFDYMAKVNSKMNGNYRQPGYMWGVNAAQEQYCEDVYLAKFYRMPAQLI